MPRLALQDNTLFYGDNLEIMRWYIPDESIDLTYLDPPFNSKADYNVLFQEASGEQSTAQIKAFTDFWHWDTIARQTYEYLTSNEVDERVSNVAESMMKLLGKNDMTAYLFMMTTRLIELRRVLKPSSSLFLHCDPTASHYLKMVLDAIFGPRNFKNEIVWRRSNPKGLMSVRFANNHDTVLVYSKDEEKAKWNPSYVEYDQSNPPSLYRLREKDGRWYRLEPLSNPNLNRPNLTYEFKGMTRVWRWTKERMMEMDAKGLIYVGKDGKGVPQYKQYLDERKGIPVSDFWDDIPFAQGNEKLGYPTQKPLALLERILKAGSDEGDWILDPFCGCGTAVVAAEHLKRHWIGIDVTYLAVNVIRKRLRETYPQAKFAVEGEPQDLDAARALWKIDNGFQFQGWAVMKIGGRPKGMTGSDPRDVKKGADQGIDGWMKFNDGEGNMHRVVIQVKGGHVSVRDIRELRDTVSRQNASMGVLVTLEEPTSEMEKEVKATEPFRHPTWQHEYPKLQILTVEGILKGRLPDIPPTFSSFPQAQASKREERISHATPQDTLSPFENKRERKGKGTQGRLS